MALSSKAGCVAGGFSFFLTSVQLAAATDAASLPENAGARSTAFNHVSCSGAENEIRISVKKVAGSVGLIAADLYPNNEEGFLRGSARLKQVRFAARAPMTRFCILAPDKGDYAVALYHDRNANGEFDRSSLGLPAEPWGISNNPKVRFSPPKIESALFHVTPQGAAVEIDLN